MDFGNASDSALWSYLAPQEDQTSVWSEIADNMQPVNFDPLPGGSADIDWNALSDIFGSQPNGGGTFTAIDDTFPATSIPSPNSFGSGSFDYLNTEFHPPWEMPTQQVDSVPSSASDNSWAELTPESSQPPPVLDSVPVPNGFVAPAAASRVNSTWPLDFPWLLGYPDRYQCVAGPMPSSYGYDAGSFGLAGVESSFQAGYGQAGLYLPASVAPASNQDAFVVPQTLLGKRRRDEDDTLEDASSEANNSQGRHVRQKGKAKMATTLRVLDAGRSTNRTRYKPATRTLSGLNHKSEVVGRGAERLATPNAQGIYHPFLQGPNDQQESTSTIAQEELPWVEGGEQGAAWHHTSDMVRQQEADRANDEDGEAAEEYRFRISKRLNERHRSMLEATAADWARGAVRALKCRLCPDADFSNWEDYKRHSDTAEAHPRSISFCDSCGDYFARGDSLVRHRKNPPPECLNVSPDVAENKRTATRKAHEDFSEDLDGFLNSDGEVRGLRFFSERMKEIYPKSSKRGSRQQRRLQASE
ncbi:hypothetical protein F5148DRAFT_1292168 [Russula earlei]|uniref:Uncharacterized protein n=1 Tax=Russula earlei TaxID=71964 RepID=A0ACC0TV49_9AGAM|nr:hypothetical protein F5148DRAFT_1292168 [Russula earlei]